MYKYTLDSLTYSYGISVSPTWNFRPVLNFTQVEKEGNLCICWSISLFWLYHTVSIAKLLDRVTDLFYILQEIEKTPRLSS